eukprot:SAG22_NODE_430_length_10586_cov_6.817202_5_plen_199_part_00
MRSRCFPVGMPCGLAEFICCPFPNSAAPPAPTALFKEGGGVSTPWHQDQYYWPLDTDRAVGMWMALIDTPIEMGPIRFASRSHRDGYLGHHPISDAGDRHFSRYLADKRLDIAQPQAMAAGDATMHNGWVVHGASPNGTDRTREAMVVTYFPDGTTCGPLYNASREGDAKSFLGGKSPGEAADNDVTNPILWRGGAKL